MPRSIKLLSDYPNPPYDQVDEGDFNRKVSTDPLDYSCKCGTIVPSKKRLITARILKGVELLCPSCKNRLNRLSQ